MLVTRDLLSLNRFPVSGSTLLRVFHLEEFLGIINTPLYGLCLKVPFLQKEKTDGPMEGAGRGPSTIFPEDLRTCCPAPTGISDSRAFFDLPAFLIDALLLARFTAFTVIITWHQALLICPQILKIELRAQAFDFRRRGLELLIVLRCTLLFRSSGVFFHAASL